MEQSFKMKLWNVCKQDFLESNFAQHLTFKKNLREIGDNVRCETGKLIFLLGGISPNTQT